LQIEASLKKALSLENIRVNVPSVFTVAISTNEKIMENAAKRLLGLPPDSVKAQGTTLFLSQHMHSLSSPFFLSLLSPRYHFRTAQTSDCLDEGTTLVVYSSPTTDRNLIYLFSF